MQSQDPENDNLQSKDATDIGELEGQRLPTEVLGIVAKYLKDQAQDRTCANLNETSQELHDETRKDLWTIIRVRLEGESGEGDLAGQLKRILACKGAKHIQFFVNLNESQWFFFERDFREETDVSVGVKAVVDTANSQMRKSSAINCHLYRAFVFGSADIVNLAAAATRIHAVNGPRNKGPIKVFLHVAGNSSVSANPISKIALGATDSDAHPPIKALRISQTYGSPDIDDPLLWRAICHDALRMIYPSLLKLPPNSTDLPGLCVSGFRMEKAVECINEVISVIRLQSVFAILALDFDITDDAPFSQLKAIAHSLVPIYLGYCAGHLADKTNGSDESLTLLFLKSRQNSACSVEVTYWTKREALEFRYRGVDNDRFEADQFELSTRRSS